MPPSGKIEVAEGPPSAVVVPEDAYADVTATHEALERARDLPAPRLACVTTPAGGVSLSL